VTSVRLGFGPDISGRMSTRSAALTETNVDRHGERALQAKRTRKPESEKAYYEHHH
jgi:hypothetical protein